MLLEDVALRYVVVEFVVDGDGVNTDVLLRFSRTFTSVDLGVECVEACTEAETFFVYISTVPLCIPISVEFGVNVTGSVTVIVSDDVVSTKPLDASRF